MISAVYRIQDGQGRGPFRPGFTVKWIDPVRRLDLPSWMEEFGADAAFRGHVLGMHIGTGCESLASLAMWFSPSEIKKLRPYGYRVVKIKPDLILGQSDVQILFGCYKPLADAALIEE